MTNRSFTPAVLNTGFSAALLALTACSSSDDSNAQSENEPAPEESSKQPSHSIILSVNLEDNELGLYTFSDMTEDWNNGLDEERVTIVLADDGNPALRVYYPNGAVGPDDTGAQWKVNFAAQETACVSYHLKLQEDFLFGLGGKLPGPAGGDANTGGQQFVPNGQDGFSLRPMWREQGRLIHYVYSYQVEPEGEPVAQYDIEWQDASGAPIYLVAGETHTIETCATMNSVSATGQANFDGRLIAYFDGKKVLDTTIGYRSTEALQLDVFYFSTFFGGNGPEWNSPQDQTIDFWNFVISTGPTTAID